MASPTADAGSFLMLKDAGNAKLAADDVEGAVEMYTAAIEAATLPAERAVALGNRSLCHMKLDNAEAALADGKASHEADAGYAKALHRVEVAEAALCRARGKKGKQAAAAPVASNSGGSSTAVFAQEAQMMEHLRAMGMPQEMLQSLTPEQKQQMLAMTQDPKILAKASAAVKAQNARAPPLAGRSGKDGGTEPVPGGAFSWKDEKAEALMEVSCAAGTEAAQVHCTIEATSIEIEVSGIQVMRGELFQRVVPSRCTWVLESDGEARKLLLTLAKEKPMRWLQIVRS